MMLNKEKGGKKALLDENREEVQEYRSDLSIGEEE